MNSYYKLFRGTFLMLVFSLLHGTGLCQSIYDVAVEKSKSERNLYILEPMASSNANLYLHKDYVPISIEKVIFFINTDDSKTIKFVKDKFRKAGIEAINFYDFECSDCDTAEKMKAYIKKQGFQSIVQITMTSEIEKNIGMRFSYFQTYNTAFATATMVHWRQVYAIFEWYNDDFSEDAFMKSYAMKQSSRPNYYVLAEGCIDLSIFRPKKKGAFLVN